MNLLNILSLLLFITFITSYSMKLVVLYRKNKINANVLGKTKKDKRILKVEKAVRTSTFIWGIAWAMEIFIGDVINKNLFILFNNITINYIGIIIIATGVSIFIISMLSMKTSWRVGIDKNTKTKLVTHGIYKYSRNPAFVGFDFMFLGFFITYPNILTALITLANFISIHRLILEEERHLKTLFGKEYVNYKESVPRYM